MTGRSLGERVHQLEREVALLRLEVRSLAGRGEGEESAVPTSRSGLAGAVQTREETGRAEPTLAAHPAPEAPTVAQPPVAAPPVHAPARAAGRLREEPSLERRIGGQVFAVAGALIVIVGLALGVKVAIDQGWFRLLPPGLRCLGIAALGAFFLVAGELLRTRVRAIAVAGCNAAGLGGLYVAAYAAFAVFNLVSGPVAFALMVGAAAIGFAVALRHGSLSTAMLSLVGAYLVPILLTRPNAAPHVLPAYLLLLSAVALVLAACRPRQFGPLRDAAWIGGGALGLLWTLSQAAEHPALVVAFWGAAWTMHQGELLVTAARRELRDRPVAERAAGPRRRRAWSRRVEPVLLAVATTAGVVAVSAVVLDLETLLPHWLAPAAVFAATSVLAIVFGGHLRVLRDAPRTDLETLAAAHAAQAGALLIVTVALALGGWIEVTAWLAMGLAAVVAGRWVGARSLDAYGLVLLAIASTRLGVYDIAAGPASTPWSTAGGLAVAPWTMLVVWAGAAWMLAGALMLRSASDEDDRPIASPRPTAAVVCAAAATGAWMLAPAHPESAPASVCIAWLGLSLLLRGVWRPVPRLHLDAMACVAGVGAVLPWVAGAEFNRWIHSAQTPGTYPGLWLAAAVALALLAHAWDSRRRISWTDAPSPWPALLAIAGGVAFAASSIEIARSAALLADDETARRAALSIWWGLWGVALVVGGFWRRAAPARYVGLGLMALAAVKAVVVDLAGVPPLWRVASFVGLGVLMLGVAVLYGRVRVAMGGEGRGERV